MAKTAGRDGATGTMIYTARRVITMDASQPFAEAVAVRDGRFLGAGRVDELVGWGDHTVDTRFADHVLLPGFVEAHTHVMAGGMWQFPYVGYFDRRDPFGTTWAGCPDIDGVVERLVEVEAGMTDPGAPLIAWGLDPIYFGGERLTARHLDVVSEVRPVFVFHASAHLATVNQAMLAVSGIDAGTTTPGVSRHPDGSPDGELQEPPAMALAGGALKAIGAAMRSADAKWAYADEARNAGLTLVTDLGTTQLHDPEALAAWREVVAEPTYPVRVMVAVASGFDARVDPDELAALGRTLGAEGGEKLRFGVVKLILDGSIQGFTARLTWPHYYDPPDGHDGNGLWLIPPDQVADLVTTFHRAGLTVHCHCNGDQAAEVFIDAVAIALERHPRWDHRHTVQHSQLTTPAQYRRMAALGMCANIFSNHLYFWGDQHRDVTVGPERAAGMNACATALREGVALSIHSDAPVTPMGPLHVAWCAVNRLTASGEVLGPGERISVPEALRAVTLGAAHQLRADHEVGSIEAGKLADLAVLEDDPLEVAPEALKDIGVWGTVLGGVPFPAGAGGGSRGGSGGGGGG